MKANGRGVNSLVEKAVFNGPTHIKGLVFGLTRKAIFEEAVSIGKAGVEAGGVKVVWISGELVKKNSVVKSVMGSYGFESKKSYAKSIRVFGSNNGSSRGVVVSSDQVVFINFDKGNSLLRSDLNPMGSDFGGPAIDLYVDLGDLEHFYQKGSVGKIVTSLCSSDRRREEKKISLQESIG
ncbi:hypothetical protein LWI28_001087 [Acer negundo]|uniref:Uncharacterized protein n=1 Tax=Acer negundo TaxID=4023 RepID=A0AAD5JC24_ACENE|nr:hypothetical protein LWI28_001087 [Acer negundo]